ncbi:hypothetical protein LSAT2_008805 [Lamellibrachia satsuma]|nr:hypothetical protein LSAT2_008805 [Lamellibrachia satsuma]
MREERGMRKSMQTEGEVLRKEPRKTRKVAHMKELNQRLTSGGQMVTPVPVNVEVDSRRSMTHILHKSRCLHSTTGHDLQCSPLYRVADCSNGIGIIGLLTTLAVALVLYSDLAESQCTTRYCEDYDEADLLAVVEQLQQQFSTLSLKHERLQQQFSTLNLKHERLHQEVSTTEERNQEVVGQLQRTVTELNEELANLTKLLLPGSTLRNAARSCKQILDSASNAANGVYWICASPNCTDAREVFCDMRSGGWTLIGQISTVGDIYDKWLVTNENTDILQTPVIKRGTYGCIDAVDLAVNHANEIRLSSGENDAGMGQFWVEWDLPADRDVATFWRHYVGTSVVDSATMHSVQVQSSFAPKRFVTRTNMECGNDTKVDTHVPQTTQTPTGPMVTRA